MTITNRANLNRPLTWAEMDANFESFGVPVVTRQSLGRPLTHAEMDANFEAIKVTKPSSTLTSSRTGLGRPLTRAEMDANFSNLNSAGMTGLIASSGRYDPDTFSIRYRTEKGVDGAVYNSSFNSVPNPENPSQTVLEVVLGRDAEKVNNGYRAEITSKPTANAFNGAEYWYGFSFYIPNGWNDAAGLGHAVAQVHGDWTIPTPPPFDITIIGMGNGVSDFYIASRYSTESYLNISNDNLVETILHRQQLVKSKWYTVVYKVLLSNVAGVGSQDIWIDGVLVKSVRNTPNSVDTSNRGRYPKAGIYCRNLHTSLGEGVNSQGC